LLISTGRCLDSLAPYIHRACVQGGGSVFFEKALHHPLELPVFSLLKVVITNSSFPVDQVLRRPVLSVEFLSDQI
jgi:hypothetical protein